MPHSDVQSLVSSLQSEYGLSLEQIADETSVSASTVCRWLGGESQPRAYTESKLRQLHRMVVNGNAAFGTAAGRERVETMGHVDALLRELREALHRHGRLSSRNEALDEMAKLLFAHVSRLTAGQPGICSKALEEWPGLALPEALNALVAQAMETHLPASLSHEADPSSLQLRLSSDQGRLAHEVVAIFERIASDMPRGVGHFASDCMNEVFGKFLASSFADEKQLGQYLTPTEVVETMVQLALGDLTHEELASLTDPEKCDQFGIVLDPSCGVGSFLADFLRRTHAIVDQLHGPTSASSWLEKMSPSVIGFDKSERMVRLAMTNMATFGVGVVNLHLVNALDRRVPSAMADAEGKASIILTNPPFGAEFNGDAVSDYRLADEWATRPPKKIDSELLFMERYIDWLRPGGQLVAVLPDSILTNRGLYADLRDNLGWEVELRSVISLPMGTFAAAGTTTKTSIVHLRKRDEHDVAHATYFAVCRDIGYDVVTRGSHRVKRHNGSGELPELLEEYLAGSGGEKKGRWVPEAESEARWDAGFFTTLPMDVERRIADRRAGDVRIGDIASLVTERQDPRKLREESFRYIEISDVDAHSLTVRHKEVMCCDAPSRARKLVRSGDVLVSTVRPDRKAVAVVGPESNGAICSTGFAVLRPSGIDPLLLASLICSDFVTSQLMRNNVGIAYPAIEESCLPSVLLPVAEADLERLESPCARVRTLMHELEQARQEMERELSTSNLPD